MNSWVRHQVSLELGDVHVECAVESERGSQRRDGLSYQSVKVSVGGSFYVQIATTNVVNSLIIKHDGNVAMLEKRMSRKDCVIGLNDSRRNLRRGIDGES